MTNKTARKEKAQRKFTAEVFGNKAFNNGKKSAPVLDGEFMTWLNSLNLPVGSEGIAILKSWHRGWHTANANQAIANL